MTQPTWQWYQNPKTNHWYRTRLDDWLLSNRIGQDGGRGYQVQCQDWVRDHFAHRPHRCALDIGANMGITAVEYAQCFNTVIAFEPVPEVYEQLQMVIERNGLTNVQTHCVGLSDHAGTAHIVYRPHNSFASHVSDRGDVPIVLATVDSFGFDCVDFIKIDVEGLEPEVIAGAWQTIQQQRPVIQLEYKPKLGARSQHSIQHTCESIEDLGYTITDKRGVHWKETRLSDLFAVPRAWS